MYPPCEIRFRGVGLNFRRKIFFDLSLKRRGRIKGHVWSSLKEDGRKFKKKRPEWTWIKRIRGQSLLGGKSLGIEISLFISLPKAGYQSTSLASGPRRKIEDWDIAGCSLVSAMMPSRHHIYDRRWINERSRILFPSLSFFLSFSPCSRSEAGRATRELAAHLNSKEMYDRLERRGP